MRSLPGFEDFHVDDLGERAHLEATVQRAWQSWGWKSVPRVLLPDGFFLGGLSVHGGDPNPAVLVVPVGAVLLIAGVAFTPLALRGR